MGHSDLARFSVGAMSHRSLRSWLTIVGIVIGIAAIVSLVSIGYGLNGYINKQLESFGSNFISISPGSPKTSGGMLGMSPFAGTRASILTTNDAAAVKGVAGVESVYTVTATRFDVEYRGDTVGTAVAGVSPGVFRDFDKMIKIEFGRALTESDSHVVVIGSKFAKDSYDREIELGRTLIIGNVSFRVVGIMEKSEGSPFPVDNLVFMTPDDARTVMGSMKQENQVDMIMIRTQEGADPELIAHDITLKLRNTRHVTEDTQDFRVSTAASMMSSIGAITGAVSLFLGGIAAIALAVGGVGIANTMFMAVTERTRDIGVMKAIGARERDILEVFLIESGLMGLIGGIIGMLLGSVLSIGMNAVGVPTLLKPELLAFAVLFSLVVGMVSGFFPARKAARLQPVDALGFA